MKKILILTALALFAAGCSKPEEVKNTAPTNNAPPVNAPANTNANVSTVKEETFTAGANPRADLISATQKLQKLPFWSATVTNTINSEKIEMQYLAPDRYRIKKPEGEVIVIGSDSYSNESGKWEKLDDNIGEIIRESTQIGIEEGVKSLQDVKVVGKEKLNGKNTTVYSHELNGAIIKVWIANDSGLQLKNDVELELDGKKEKETRIYDYEKKVIIEAPKIDQ